jgi:hypothetical protein
MTQDMKQLKGMKRCWLPLKRLQIKAIVPFAQGIGYFLMELNVGAAEIVKKEVTDAPDSK